jgi:hypothetical protein
MEFFPEPRLKNPPIFTRGVTGDDSNIYLA